VRVLIDDVSWVLIIFDLLIRETPYLRGYVRLNLLEIKETLQPAQASWSPVFAVG
jgi:hypothetical protein